MRRLALRVSSLMIGFGLLHANVDCAAYAAGGLQTDRSETIVIGAVSADPKSRYPKIEAMARYLAERLEDVGIHHSFAIVAKNNAEFASLLHEGAVDVFSESIFSGIYFAETVGAEFLLREWKKGSSEYQTVFFTRSGSNIDSIGDLRGRKIAFQDRGSTSAFLLPLAILKQHGLKVNGLSGPMSIGPPDSVSYVFAIEEMNIAAWVTRGLADAGAFSSQD
jgi:phosphonate transport system substrate-binding protein